MKKAVKYYQVNVGLLRLRALTDKLWQISLHHPHMLSLRGYHLHNIYHILGRRLAALYRGTFALSSAPSVHNPGC